MEHGANCHDLAQTAVSTEIVDSIGNLKAEDVKLGRPHTGRSFRQTPHYAAPYFLRPIWSPSNYSPFRDHIQNAGTPTRHILVDEPRQRFLVVNELFDRDAYDNKGFSSCSLQVVIDDHKVYVGQPCALSPRMIIRRQKQMLLLHSAR
jgi:hypothetical protein